VNLPCLLKAALAFYDADEGGSQERMADVGILISLGTILITLGVLVIAVAFFLAYFKKSERGKISGGGAVIIGPIPIVFGTDKKALRTVLFLSIVLTLLVLGVMIVSYLLR